MPIRGIGAAAYRGACLVGGARRWPLLGIAELHRLRENDPDVAFNLDFR